MDKWWLYRVAQKEATLVISNFNNVVDKMPLLFILLDRKLDRLDRNN